MGLSEIRERLKAKMPLSMTYKDGGKTEVFHLGDKTLEMPAMSSDDAIVQNLQKIDSHFGKPQTTSKSMSITGLQSGAFKAMLEELKKEISDAQTKAVSDVHAAKADAVNQVTTTVAGVKAKIQSEVSDALQEFAQFTNGGPA